MFDGDTIFAVATGRVDTDVSVAGLLAARIMEQAVVMAVKKATPLCGLELPFGIIASINGAKS